MVDVFLFLISTGFKYFLFCDTLISTLLSQLSITAHILIRPEEREQQKIIK